MQTNSQRDGLPHVSSLLPDYLNNKLETALKQGVESHLSECSECRQEADRLTELFQALQKETPSSPPSHYFSTIVPRVRERLERRERFSWLQHPVFTRVAMPLAAAALAVALLVRLPVELQESTSQPLLDRSESLNPEEVAEALVQQHELLPLNTVVVQEIAEATVPAKVFEQQIAEKLIVSSSKQPYDYFSGIPTEQLLNSLNEQEVETLLQRLGERIIL